MRRREREKNAILNVGGSGGSGGGGGLSLLFSKSVPLFLSSLSLSPVAAARQDPGQSGATGPMPGPYIYWPTLWSPSILSLFSFSFSLSYP